MSRIVTFYSYKGGVGHTVALANIGVLLARGGKRVLLLDFDLEVQDFTVISILTWKMSSHQKGG